MEWVISFNYYGRKWVYLICSGVHSRIHSRHSVSYRIGVLFCLFHARYSAAPTMTALHTCFYDYFLFFVCLPLRQFLINIAVVNDVALEWATAVSSRRTSRCPSVASRCPTSLSLSFAHTHTRNRTSNRPIDRRHQHSNGYYLCLAVFHLCRFTFPVCCCFSPVFSSGGALNLT